MNGLIKPEIHLMNFRGGHPATILKHVSDALLLAGNDVRLVEAVRREMCSQDYDYLLFIAFEVCA